MSNLNALGESFERLQPRSAANISTGADLQLADHKLPGLSSRQEMIEL